MFGVWTFGYGVSAGCFKGWLVLPTFKNGNQLVSREFRFCNYSFEWTHLFCKTLTWDVKFDPASQKFDVWYQVYDAHHEFVAFGVFFG